MPTLQVSTSQNANLLRQKMEFCYSPVVGIDEDRRALSFHELFHAFQFGFAGIPLEQATTSQIEKFKWVIEGTATAAEKSTTTMTRESSGSSSRRPCIDIG